MSATVRKVLLVVPLLCLLSLFSLSSFPAQASPFTFTLAKSQTEPLAGVKCYVFNSAGSYLGISGTSDSTGVVSFNLADGNFKFRIDYLGYQYWSGVYSVPTQLSGALEIQHQDVVVRVEGVNQGEPEPMQGVKVYLFTASGSYQGQFRVTDSSGEATFNLPERSYKVRADYLGQQHWSEGFTWQDAIIPISMGEAEVTVTGSGIPLSGVSVYVFSGAGSYLGKSGTTNPSGKVVFTLPAGSYKYRADYQGSQYWSVAELLVAGQTNPVSISTGGGTFALTVKKSEEEPLSELSCYVFNSAGSYLGISGTSSSGGVVSFNLADGAYKFRVDYLGYQFWSNLYTIPGSLTGALVIPHQDIVVRVEGISQGAPEPMQGVKVYLFTASGSYQGQSLVTDSSGEATFNLPERSYKVRADYLGQQFWSEAFTWEDKTVTVPMGDAGVTVTGSGLPLEGVKVYVFSASGAYLGISGTTDSTGKAVFTLPEGGYKYRADYQTNQFWSGVEALVAGQSNPVNLSTGGGIFSLTIKQSDTEPLSGLRCYAFNGAGSYLGLNATSDTAGIVAFDLSDGVYKFRVDYLGYQFWSDVYAVPNSLAGNLTIQHEDVVIRVEGVNQGAPEPMQGVKLYLFTESGSYQGQSRVTDGSGEAIFNLPEQDYKVRADYLGQQFWSDVLPWQDTIIAIPLGNSEVTASSDLPLAGVKVYVFSTEGSYLGIAGATDADGKVVFNLAAGSYKFRVDYQGSQYWSNQTTLTAGQLTPISICTSETKLLAGDGQAGDQFGASVSVSENFAIIGSPGNDDMAEDGGAAYVFSRASSWAEYEKLMASDSEEGDRLGASVSMSGAFAIVGSTGDDDFGTDSGSAYIFHHDGNTWTEHSKISSGDGRTGDSFGCSVCISGSSAIVGAEGYDGGQGGGWDGTHIAEFEGLGMQWWWEDHWESYYGDYTLAPTGTWAIGFRPSKIRLTLNSSVPLELLSVRDATGTIIFGETSGYLSGDELVLDCMSDIGQIHILRESGYPRILGIEFYVSGESGGENSGVAYVFRFDGSSWSKQAKLIPEDTEPGGHLGASVGLDGDYAIVGAYGKDNSGEDSGCAYIFKFDGSSWIEQFKLVATDAQAGDRFGVSVSISGDYAIVGADSNDGQGTDSGAAYIFRRYGSVWTQQAKLTAGGGRSGDQFGASVSINGSYATIGAVGCDGKGTDSGAVYVFRREGADWIEKTKYVSNAGSAGDRFGASVAVGNGYVLLGARPSDDKGPDSGSAGIYAMGSYHDAALKAYPEIIPLGASAILSWSSINAVSVTIDQGIGVVPLNGTTSVSPEVTTTYTMTATGPHGTDTNDVTVAVDQPPSLTLKEPNEVGDRVHNRFTIQWTDVDAEQNAEISLYYDSDGISADGTLIVSGLREDPDGWGNDNYVWDTSNIPEGTYHIYAVIDDGFNDPVVVYSSGVLVVDHHLYPEATVSFTSSGYNPQIGSSVSVSGDFAIAGAPGDSHDGMSWSGSAYILKRSGGNWLEISKLVASDAGDRDWFGISVSISGEYAIVGAQGDFVDGNHSGSAYVFKREGSNWIEQTKLVPSDTNVADSFGWSVSIKGDSVVIGAPGTRSGGYPRAGAAYVFRRNGSSWVQEAKLTASDPSYLAGFGSSVCINNDYIIIGAGWGSDIAESGGSAYIFNRDGSAWLEQAKLVGSDAGACDAFGYAVSIDANYAIVGAPHSEWDPEIGFEPGAAYVFKREGSTWIQQAKLAPINGAEDDYFGNAVSISGDYALVGAEWAHEGLYGHRIGSAYVFNREGSVWKEFVELIPSPGSYDESGGVWFGSAVAVSGSDVIVGASAAGSAYTYSLIPLSLRASAERILVGGSATLSWDCPEATSVTINNGIGAVPAHGSITLSPSATTTYTITATTPWGTRTVGITIVVDTIAIHIGSPLNGSSIPRSDTMIEGTIVNPLGLEVGVNVNGIVALVEGGRFVANRIPLDQGDNTIIATATSSEGHTASAEVTVSADPTDDYVRIKADPESGIAPFETTLRVEASFSFSTSTLSYSDPGGVQVLTNPTANEYTVAMTAPGLYEFTVQVTDGQGNVHADSATVLVIDQAVLDGILRAKWNAMKNALIAADNQKALSCFHSGTKPDYEEIFSALGTRLPGIASGMGEISPIYFRDRISKYRIRREEVVQGQTYDITYYIYFVKDSNGLWQIESF